MTFYESGAFLRRVTVFGQGVMIFLLIIENLRTIGDNHVNTMSNPSPILIYKISERELRLAHI